MFPFCLFTSGFLGDGIKVASVTVFGFLSLTVAAMLLACLHWLHQHPFCPNCLGTDSKMLIYQTSLPWFQCVFLQCPKIQAVIAF